MARSLEALVKKPTAEETPARFSILNQAEKRLTVLLRSIDREAANTEFGVQASPRDAARLLRPFIVTDILALIGGFLFSWLMAAAVNNVFFDRSDLNALAGAGLTHILPFALLSVGVVIWFAHTGHYQVRMPFWTESKKVVETLFFAMLIEGFLQFVVKESFSRLSLLSCWVFACVGILVLRSAWRGVLRRRGEWEIPTLVVGGGPTAEEALLAVNSEAALGYKPVAQLKDLTDALQSVNHSWSMLCRVHGASHVIIALDGEDFIQARQSLAQLMREDVPFSVSPPMHNLSVFAMVPQSFLGRDVMLLTRNNGLDRPLPRFFKRSFDILLSSATLIVFSPFIIGLALAVKADGGPVLYRHPRVGMNGQPFSCLKFRSMVVKSEEVLQKHLETNELARAEWQRDHKLRKDPRVTRIGAFLRRTSLDELPQLLNVLKGEMSLVGPRPIIVAEMPKYDNDIAFYYRVRPGLTGLWQVSGRSDVPYPERVRMDSWYVRNWSLWHDIAIICKTFPEVLRRRGAY